MQQDLNVEMDPPPGGLLGMGSRIAFVADVPSAFALSSSPLPDDGYGKTSL
jgi:hypothetical protein